MKAPGRIVTVALLAASIGLQAQPVDSSGHQASGADDGSVISDGLQFQNTLPELAANPDNGDVLVVWTHTDSAQLSEVRARLLTRKGGSGRGSTATYEPGPLHRLSAKGAFRNEPAVAWIPDRREYLVVWTDFQRGPLESRTISRKGKLGKLRTLVSDGILNGLSRLLVDEHDEGVDVTLYYSQFGVAGRGAAKVVTLVSRVLRQDKKYKTAPAVALVPSAEVLDVSEFKTETGRPGQYQMLLYRDTETTDLVFGIRDTDTDQFQEIHRLGNDGGFDLVIASRIETRSDGLFGITVSGLKNRSLVSFTYVGQVDLAGGDLSLVFAGSSSKGFAALLALPDPFLVPARAEAPKESLGPVVVAERGGNIVHRKMATNAKPFGKKTTIASHGGNLDTMEMLMLRADNRSTFLDDDPNGIVAWEQTTSATSSELRVATFFVKPKQALGSVHPASNLDALAGLPNVVAGDA